MPYQTTYYGNPHSRTHAFGWQAEDAVEHARKQVADLIKVIIKLNDNSDIFSKVENMLLIFVRFI